MRKNSRSKFQPSAVSAEEIQEVLEQLRAEGKVEIIGHRKGKPVYRYVNRRGHAKLGFAETGEPDVPTPK
jgi:hypothetical protein